MKWFLKLNKLLKLVIIVLSVVAVAFIYVSYKKCEVKTAVEDYLYEDLGLSKNEVLEVTLNITNLPGDKQWMAYVKVKDDPKGYFYFKNNKDEVILESYNLNDAILAPNE